MIFSATVEEVLVDRDSETPVSEPELEPVAPVVFSKELYEDAVVHFMQRYHGVDRGQLHTALSGILYNLIAERLG